MHRVVCGCQRFAGKPGLSAILCQFGLRPLQLLLPIPQPLPVTLEVLSSLIQTTAGLIEIALQLTTPLLRKTQRLLNAGDLAADRVELLLRPIQGIRCLCLLSTCAFNFTHRMRDFGFRGLAFDV